MSVDARVLDLPAQAKAIAREYHLVTGRPLGVTGEVAEDEAARILERDAVVLALSAPGSRARNECGAMSVSRFRSIGRLRWARDG